MFSSSSGHVEGLRTGKALCLCKLIDHSALSAPRFARFRKLILFKILMSAEQHDFLFAFLFVVSKYLKKTNMDFFCTHLNLIGFTLFAYHVLSV